MPTRLSTAERAAIGVWIAGVLASVAAAALVWMAPGRVLFLVDLDRHVRPLPAPYQTALQTLAAGVAAVLVLLTAAVAANWRRARPLFARVYGAPAEAFLGLVAADWRSWRQDSAFPAHAATLTMLIGLGLWFRLTPLYFPVSYDESISLVWFASRGWLDVLSDYTIPNNHILYNLFVNAIIAAGHVSPAAIRLPALVAGLLLIPASYWLVRRLLGGETALLTAGLVAAAPVMVEYSTQGRGYTLLWLLFTIAFILATYLRDQRNLFGWAPVALTTAAGLWAMPVMIYCVAAICIWLLLSAPRARRVPLILELAGTGAATAALAGVAYTPVLIRTKAWTLTRGHRAAVLHYPHLIVEWTTDLHVIFLAAFAVGLVMLLVARPRELRAWHLLAAGILAQLGLGIAGTFPPNRVLNYLFIPVAGVASYALARASQKWIGRLSWGAWAWTSVVLIVAGSWGWTRLEHTRVVTDAAGVTWVGKLAPGADGTTCCADGYFVDAKPVVTDLAPHLQPGDAIVAKDLMGSVETMRFYLIEAGLNPILVHPYRGEFGLRQLDPYGQLYVLVKGASVAQTLGVSDAELEATYRPPVAIASYRTSSVYRLDRIVPDPRSRAERGPVPLNMFWYW